MGGHTFFKNLFQFPLILTLILFSKQSTIICDPSIQPTPTYKTFLMSHSSISSLALKEEPIYESLKKYSSCQDEQFEHELSSVAIKRYLADYEESSGKMRTLGTTQYGNAIADHPLLSFRLIYRFANDLTILKLLDVGVNEILQESFITISISTGWPVLSDVENAVLAILRIHHVYDANLTEFARGNIFGSDTRFGLPAIHCYEIGRLAIKSEYFAYAIEWLEFAKLLVETENDSTIDADLVNTRLSEAIETHDSELGMREFHESLFFVHELRNLNPNLPRLKRRNLQARIWKGRREVNYNAINFWSLCSGEDLRTEEEKSQLHCWYEKESNPGWTISPLKIEQLANTPYLVQIYEVLTPTLIDKLIERAESELGLAGLFTTEGDKIGKDRTSLSSWIPDRPNLEFENIPKRIELATGLKALPLSSSERLQIATYTFGGHYEVHQDVLKNEVGFWANTWGDRIATFMIYLSDVEKGGYTAFPQAGIAAKPVKNSAVFWFNMKRNGKPDENSWHGACPVILGSKWVANKWIRSNDQFMTRPCGLNPDE